MLRNQALVVGLRFNCQKKPFVKKQFIVLFFFLRNTLDFYQVETFMAWITDPRNKNTSPPPKKNKTNSPVLFQLLPSPGISGLFPLVLRTF